MGLKSKIEDFKKLKRFIESRNFNGDDGGNPLEEIIKYAQQYPKLDGQLRATQTYDLIRRIEKNIKEKGITYASKRGLEELGVKYKINGLDNLVEGGSAIYVSNHPYGIVDGLILIGALAGELEKKGENLKIIGTNKLRMVEGIEKRVIFIDEPLGLKKDEFRTTKVKPNLSPMRELFKHLRSKGNISIFPSGQVSGIKLKEYPWIPSLGRMATHCDYVVPMWFNGPNHGFTYNSLTRINPRLRMLAFLEEAWNKKGKTVTLNIGTPLSKEEIKNKGITNGEITRYIRNQAETLKK